MSENLQSSAFNIALNAKSFRVLSSTIYSDKIGSIVREISTNAADAHIAAGTPNTAFEIHLPDAFEPYFSVKDFGTGLSSEEVFGIYTTYFSSSKDKSNDQTGMLGIGSKSPFSYTDSFTVESIKDGVRGIYSAFIADNGIPSVTQMFSEPTDKGNGTTITISVKKEDFSKFADAVVAQLSFFKVKPIIVNSNIKFAEKEYFYESKNIRISYNKQYGTGDIYIVQGNIGYRVISLNLKNKLPTSDFILYERLCQYRTELLFDIGEIGVTASREDIEYDKYTIENISNKLKEVEKEITDHVAKEIKKAENNWEIAKLVNSNHIWKYFALKNNLIDSSLKLSHGEIHFMIDNTKIADSLGIKIELHTKEQYENMYRRYRSPVYNVYPHRVSEGFVIVINDVKSLNNIRLKEFQSKLGKQYCILQYKIDNFEKAKELKKELINTLGGFDNIHFLSDVVLPKREKVERKRSTTASHYLIKGKEFSKWESQFSGVENITTKTVYVETNGRGIHYDMSRLVDTYFLISKLDSSIPKLIGIPNRNIDFVGQNHNLISINKYIEELTNFYKKDAATMIKSKRAKLKAKLLNSVIYRLANSKEFIHEMQYINPKSKTLKLINICNKLDKMKYDPSVADFLAVGYAKEIKFNLKNIEEDFSLVLESIRYGYKITNAKKLAEYINWLENK